MAIRMVIFDKDGTLMDFDSFWVTVSRLAVADILEELHADAGLADALLSAMGVTEGVTDVQGVLCWGTYRQMGEVLHAALQENGVACELEDVVKLTSRTYHAHADQGIIQPACGDIKRVLGAHLREDRKLALITTDGPVVTRKCLESMDIGPYFSAICTDDGMFPPKPDPTCIEVLCEQFGLAKDEIVMVGDTMTDVRFARNGGIRVIAVNKTEAGRAFFAAEADAVTEDISGVYDILAKWEDKK